MGAIDQTKDYAEKVIELNKHSLLLMCETLKSKSELCLSFDLPLYRNRTSMAIENRIRTGSKLKDPVIPVRYVRFRSCSNIYIVGGCAEIIRAVLATLIMKLHNFNENIYFQSNFLK